MQMSSRPIGWKYINLFAHAHDSLLRFKLSINEGKNGNLSFFEYGIVVGARWDG